MSFDHPKLIAHRFGRYLGPDLALSTLQKLLAEPSSMIGGVEIDCVLSKDNQLVLLHDNHLNETTTFSGWAKDYSAAELLNSYIVHNGQKTEEHPILLEDLWPHLSKDPRELIVQIETKSYQDDELAQKTAKEIVKALKLQDIPSNVSLECISFWPSSCEITAGEGFKTRFITNVMPHMQDACEWAKAHVVEGFVLEHPYLTDELLKMVKECGLSWTSGNLVHPWQYDLVSNMSYAPQAVCTDNPLALASLYDQENPQTADKTL